MLALWLACTCIGINPAAFSCDLCAVYSAENAREQSEAGFVLTLSEAFTPYGTVLLDGREVSGNDLDFRDSSVTHLVPGYNFSEPLKRMDIVWNAETIAKLFEVGPSRYTPGTKMPEQTIPDPTDRAALVRFLEEATKR